MAEKNIKNKIKSGIQTAKQYWHTPAKGNYIPYKEVASLSGAGFGVHWMTLLASAIGLDASNLVLGASLNINPTHLQTMLVVANLVGITLGIFRSWLYDNHRMKGGKFLPFTSRVVRDHYTRSRAQDLSLRGFNREFFFDSFRPFILENS